MKYNFPYFRSMQGSYDYDMKISPADDMLYIKFWSDEINLGQIRKTTYEIKVGEDVLSRVTNKYKCCLLT